MFGRFLEHKNWPSALPSVRARGFRITKCYTSVKRSISSSLSLIKARSMASTCTPGARPPTSVFMAPWAPVPLLTQFVHV